MSIQIGIGIWPRSHGGRIRRIGFSMLLALLFCIQAQAQFRTTAVAGGVEITQYNGTAADVVIPATYNGQTVVGIARNAFMGEWFTSVSIPNTVTNIEPEALSYCPNLMSIDMPVPNAYYCTVNGVLFNRSKTTLVQYPGGKSGSYVIPQSVTTINDQAFHNSPNLTSVTMSDSVTSMGDNVFTGCTSLTKVVFSNNILSTGYECFTGCTSLSKVTLPSRLLNIGVGCFRGCSSLVHISIPDSVTNISQYAFDSCGSLTVLNIPDSVVSIGFLAFSNSPSIVTITLGKNVTSIGDDAFYNCSKLTAINVTAENSTFSSVNGVLFNYDQTTIVTCPGGRSGSYSIPDGVTTIGYGAFQYCSALTQVGIPHSVASIGASAFARSGLTDVDLPSTVTGIVRSEFEGCNNLTTVTIPDSITTVESDAFTSCTGLTKITFSANVVSLAAGVFYNCPNLTNATFLGDAPSMGRNVFDIVAPSFSVYFKTGAIGFTSPTWTDSAGDSYPAVDLENLPVPTITGSLASSGVYGSAFSGYTIAASGSPTGFNATGLPPGLSIDTKTGIISGTPTQSGTFTVGLVATNQFGDGAASLALTIAKAPLIVAVNSGGQTLYGSTPVNPGILVTGGALYNGDTLSGIGLSDDFALTAASPVGSYQINITGTAANYQVTAQSASYSILPLSFSQWAARYPNLTDTVASDTPLHDGVPTLLKYVHNIDPTRPMTAGDWQKVSSVSTTGLGQTLTYNKSAAIDPSLALQVEVSPDLIQWIPIVDGTNGTITITPQSSGDSIITVQVPIFSPKQFIRLHAVTP